MLQLREILLPNLKNEKIIFLQPTGLLDTNIFLVYTNQRNIYLYDAQMMQYEYITSTTFLRLKENQKLITYVHRNYFVIAEQKNTRAILLDLSTKKIIKKIERGDYQVEHCSFPIAFYEKDDLHFLIYARDWNVLDIFCIENKQVLTKRKVEYETKQNYVDYFHSTLQVSPKQTYFLSNGWVWSPFDVITIYKIEDFLLTYEKCHQSIEYPAMTTGYNWDRPCCWVEDNILAVSYHPKEDEGDDDSSAQIFFVDIEKKNIIKIIDIEVFDSREYCRYELKGDLYFYKQKGYFIATAKERGISIFDEEGNLHYQLKCKENYTYFSQKNIFYSTNITDMKIFVLEFS